MSRICPFDGCMVEIPSSLFACRQHWNLLTSDERAEINDAYRQWQTGELSAVELRNRQHCVVAEAASRKRKGKS